MTSNCVLKADAWQHVVVTKATDGKTVLYVNGKPVIREKMRVHSEGKDGGAYGDDSAVTTAREVYAARRISGQNSWPNQGCVGDHFWEGYISHIAIFDTDLDSSDVALLAKI